MPESNINFDKLLLRTVFSFMTCDGHISPEELALIRQLAKENENFGSLDLEKEIEKMIELINIRGLDYFDDYFKKLSRQELSEEQEIKILETAIQTITADHKIKPEEISFLKILRTVLKSPDKKILDKFPEVAKDFIEKDKLTEIYIKELYQNYFKKQELPTFDLSQVTDISDSIDYGG